MAFSFFLSIVGLLGFSLSGMLIWGWLSSRQKWQAKYDLLKSQFSELQHQLTFELDCLLEEKDIAVKTFAGIGEQVLLRINDGPKLSKVFSQNCRLLLSDPHQVKGAIAQLAALGQEKLSYDTLLIARKHWERKFEKSKTEEEKTTTGETLAQIVNAISHIKSNTNVS
jgi:hypothetical protein